MLGWEFRLQGLGFGYPDFRPQIQGLDVRAYSLAVGGFYAFMVHCLLLPVSGLGV